MQIKKGAVRTPKTLLFSGHGRPCLDSLSAFNDPIMSRFQSRLREPYNFKKELNSQRMTFNSGEPELIRSETRLALMIFYI